MLATILGFIVGALVVLFLWLIIEKHRENLVYDGELIIDRSDPDNLPEIYLQFSSAAKLVDGAILECKVIEKTSHKKHPL